MDSCTWSMLLKKCLAHDKHKMRKGYLHGLNISGSFSSLDGKICGKSILCVFLPDRKAFIGNMEGAVCYHQSVDKREFFLTVIIKSNQSS